MTKLKATIISSTALLIMASIVSAGSATANPAAQRHDELGKSFLVNQNFELAIKEFNASLKLSPKSAETLVDRGTAYNGLKKYDLAMKDFNEAAKIAPNNYLAYNNRGVTYFRTGEIALAIKDFDKAIENDPNQAFPYLNRAGASLCNGTGGDAAEKISKWLRKSNWKGDYCGHAAILGALGYRQGNKPAQAKALVEEALKKTDNLKWPYPTLKYLSGKINGKELMEEAELSDYASTQAHCFVALNLLLNKDKKQAQNHLDWVVKTGTQNSVEYWIAKGLTKQPDVQTATSKPASPQSSANQPTPKKQATR